MRKGCCYLLVAYLVIGYVFIKYGFTNEELAHAWGHTGTVTNGQFYTSVLSWPIGLLFKMDPYFEWLQEPHQ